MAGAQHLPSCHPRLSRKVKGEKSVGREGQVSVVEMVASKLGLV